MKTNLIYFLRRATCLKQKESTSLYSVNTNENQKSLKRVALVFINFSLTFIDVIDY